MKVTLQMKDRDGTVIKEVTGEMPDDVLQTLTPTNHESDTKHRGGKGLS